MDKLIKKAMANFKRDCPKGEIRSIDIMEGSGSYKNWTDGRFKIEYVEEAGGKYKQYYTEVSKEVK